jgi:hypothetical protein
MKQIFRCLMFATVGVSVGCVSAVALAPGADQVKLTHNAADVASCKAVGNVTGLSDRKGTLDIEPLLRNRTIGLGGNTVFLTQGEFEGVAYRCP